MCVCVCIHVHICECYARSRGFGQTWAGTLCPGALKNCSAGSRKSIRPRVAFWCLGTTSPQRWSQKWYGSGSMWHFLHVPQFMPIYACLQSNIEQPWSLNRFAPRGRPCGPAARGDWKWVRSARDNGRRSREWPRLGERTNQQLLIWPTRGIITDCPYGKVWQSRKAIFRSIQTSTVIQMEDLQGPRVEHVVTPRVLRSDASSIHRQDGARMEYLQGYLSQMHKAISKGVEVKGYLATWIQIDWDCLRMGRLWKPH